MIGYYIQSSLAELHGLCHKKLEFVPPGPNILQYLIPLELIFQWHVEIYGPSLK